MTKPTAFAGSTLPAWRRNAIARDVRNARTLAYWLLSHERIGAAALAVDGLDSELLCIEGELEEPHGGNISNCGLTREIAAVQGAVADADPVVKAQLRALVVSAQAVQRALGARSTAASGIRRAVREPAATTRERISAIVPAMPRHRAVANASAVAAGSTLLFARTGRARAVAAALGASRAALAAVAGGRALPREVDWAWGAAAVIAPFVLGYLRRDPLAAAVHVAAGVGVIANVALQSRGSIAKPEGNQGDELLAVGL